MCMSGYGLCHGACNRYNYFENRAEDGCDLEAQTGLRETSGLNCSKINLIHVESKDKCMFSMMASVGITSEYCKLIYFHLISTQ